MQNDAGNDPYCNVDEGYQGDDADSRERDSAEAWEAGVLGAHFVQEGRLFGCDFVRTSLGLCGGGNSLRANTDFDLDVSRGS